MFHKTNWYVAGLSRESHKSVEKEGIATNLFAPCPIFIFEPCGSRTLDVVKA
jgi:hypothetical protein